METTDIPPSRDEARLAPSLNPGKVTCILWESAVEAAVKTFLILLFGGIAIGLMGNLWRQMTPSSPPLLPANPPLEADSSRWWPAISSTFHQHRWLIVYGVVFLLMVRARLIECKGSGSDRISRISRRLTGDWFRLIVGNAFVALFAAIALFWIGQFSVTQWLYHGLFDAIVPSLDALAQKLFGSALADTIRAWLAWYGENQFKFNFWFLYLTAIGDDLGIPNLKTLGRWLWRRLRQRWPDRGME